MHRDSTGVTHIGHLLNTRALVHWGVLDNPGAVTNQGLQLNDRAARATECFLLTHDRGLNRRGHRTAQQNLNLSQPVCRFFVDLCKDPRCCEHNGCVKLDMWVLPDRLTHPTSRGSQERPLRSSAVPICTSISSLHYNI